MFETLEFSACPLPQYEDPRRVLDCLPVLLHPGLAHNTGFWGGFKLSVQAKSALEALLCYFFGFGA